MISQPPQFTDQLIAAALADEKRVHFESSAENEHPDCVRIAAAWLDAQTRLDRGHIGQSHALKHIIEGWGGRYLSTLDVMAAARLLSIRGKYPYLGISSKITFPDISRLKGIGEAMTQLNYCGGHFDCYKRTELGVPVRTAVEAYAAHLVGLGKPPVDERHLELVITKGFGFGY